MKIVSNLKTILAIALLLVMLSSIASAIDVKTLTVSANPMESTKGSFAVGITPNQVIPGGTALVSLSNGSPGSDTSSVSLNGLIQVVSGYLLSNNPDTDTLTVTIIDANHPIGNPIMTETISEISTWPKPTVTYRDP